MMGLRTLVLAVAALAVGLPASAQHAVEVPLAYHGGKLVVPVEASDGTQLHFAVSTGSDRTVLSESAAARIGDMTLSLGGLSVPTAPVAKVPDGQMMAGGMTLDGQISSNMLADYDVLIDVPGERLVLKPVGRSVSWDGVALSDPISLRILHGVVISLDVEVNGTEYLAALELGSSTLLANAGMKSELGLADEDRVALGLGSTTFADAALRVVDLPIFQRWSPNGAGFVLVGGGIAADCAISLSWVHREMRVCAR